MCAKRLATEAIAKGSQDNVTVIVTFLSPVSTVEQVYCKGRQSSSGQAARQHQPRSGLQNQKGVAADELRETY